MQHDDDTAARFDEAFGYGWRGAYADAIGINRKTASAMEGPTARHAAALLELLDRVHPELWPERWAPLRELYYRQRIAKKGTST